MNDKKRLIMQNIRYNIETYKPQFAIFEDTFAGKNIDTLKKLSTVHGNIEAILLDNGIDWIKLSPQHIKKIIVLKADKTAKQRVNDYVNKKYNIDVDNNSADSISCILCYLQENNIIVNDYLEIMEDKNVNLS